MPNNDERAIIENAISEIEKESPHETDGKWLERLAVDVAPLIGDWDVQDAWLWGEWPHRKANLPKSTSQDVGIDAVARRRSDGKYVAIQCKARKLDADGRGAAIGHAEAGKFASPAGGELWAENWIVTNSDSALARNAARAVDLRGKPIKTINIADALERERSSRTSYDETCAHCEDRSAVRTKTCMQNEAVAESVRILRDHERSDKDEIPVGEARGRIILPCGTGKTRISLRIIEELTNPGEVSIVLCPSIALVAQIRREYLENKKVPLDILAVCSDETAGFNPKTGFDPKKEGSRNAARDPTIDNGSVSESEIKGRVTTDANEIAKWMRQPSFNESAIKVLIGTYQSSVRVSEALLPTDGTDGREGVRAAVLIADEAHRTAGLKRRNSQSASARGEEKRVRDFTVCHDQDRFPATYRVYQTATPRIYDPKRVVRNENWIVRSMDDPATFGVVLYRKSYSDAVGNGWLSDYRIIAVGVNGQSAFDTSNFLALNTESAGRRKLTTVHYLRGLAFALAMGGATQGGEVDIRSCIAFMNTVDKSKNMARDLATEPVKDWVSKWLAENADGQPAADYSLEHLDASSNSAQRESAKSRLAAADSDNPRGVINVGIFGEGTDSPSLSAVAFLEARKSPIDVVQAVGRAMRTAPGKRFGYIICPILIPPSADPESWLKNSDSDEGWQELGEILLALRAHDKRIEEELEHLLYLYMPEPPPAERSVIAVANRETKRIEYWEYEGPVGAAEETAERLLNGESREAVGAVAIGEPPPTPYKADEPTITVAAKTNGDGSQEIRMDTVARGKPGADGEPGPVDIEKTKIKAKDMINNGAGKRVKIGQRGKKRNQNENGKKRKPRRTGEEVSRESAQRMLRLSGMGEDGGAIKMNLLAKSGLAGDRVMRDLNILEASVNEASRHLRDDELLPALNRHFGMDRLKNNPKAADGCAVAALLMMNAAMLHQRIANGGWLTGVADMATVKNDPDAARTIRAQWERIMRHDFRPVLEPAVDAIYAVEDTGKLAGLERALRHIAAEAERIAETYADMGADHAGPLFNRVMGNQASDGAFFTRPVAASLAARLTLDAAGEADWTKPQTWRDRKTLDPACGSGTLLAALLADMKRRAKDAGADEETLAALQKIAVEETVKGLDINPVSLQLAASQLTAGNRRVSYIGMGLHLMPYGPDRYDPAKVSAGTLELLGQRAIVARPTELGLADESIASQTVWGDAGLENAVKAARDARIVIMNPPFTYRAKMGEKFAPETQRKLRERADQMGLKLTQSDLELESLYKNSIGPLFVALADKCVVNEDGVLTMINPTIALCNPSGLGERLILAQRYHIHTVLTSHQPSNISMSQHTNINESIIVMRRHDGPKPPTRFINLDRMPADDGEASDFHRCLTDCDEGLIANGWGEVSYWDAERIEAGDWTPAIWRSPELADAAIKFADHPDLQRMGDIPGAQAHATGIVLRVSFKSSEQGDLGKFPILRSKGADGQQTIRSEPDDCWVPKSGAKSETDNLLQKAGHLLITAGQDNSTGRLTATADSEKYVGNGWMPVTGLSETEAKAIAVFINSTVGRLQLMRNPGRKLAFPQYSVAEAENIRVPDIKNVRIRRILAACWERTRDALVPQFRDGECEVRAQWDAAVADAMGWDASELTRLRGLLHREPHVRGLGYGQYGDG